MQTPTFEKPFLGVSDVPGRGLRRQITQTGSQNHGYTSYAIPKTHMEPCKATLEEERRLYTYLEPCLRYSMGILVPQTLRTSTLEESLGPSVGGFVTYHLTLSN